MKSCFRKICSVILVVLIIISSLPLSAVSLTAKQQEDFYRVNTWWQDAENKEFIDWLLESDNFLYHLDITEGDIIHDMSYAGLNLNAKERKDNFVEILTSFIGLSYDEIREASVGEALSNMSMEFLNGFEDYLEATELYTVEQFEYMSKAIKETSDYYLNHYYGINTDMDQYGYETIYQRIQSAFDNRVQNFDFPDRKAETMDAFFDFVASSEWLNKLSSISNVFSLVGDGLNIAQEGFALLGEVESYEKTDERLIELLKYIRSRTTDSALRAACDEIIVKFDNSYTENIVAGVLELLDEGIVDLTFDIAKEMIVGKCGIYNLFAKVGITAGNVVSDIWFNTTETKYQMQTIYCLNSISELLVPLLNNELDDLFYYDEISEFRANYAADAIYHMSVLIELRRWGEEGYYKLKDSVYSSNIITTCKTLGWVSLANDKQIIEAWYSEFKSVIEAVEVWLFKTIPANYYYEEPKPALYEIKNSKLVAYNGTSTSVYLPTSSLKTNYDTIAENAFKDNETIISVHIPYTVKEIESYAFNNCTNLKSITINEVDVIIAENAFYNCNAELTIYGYENSTAHEFAIANNINFVSLYSEYDDAQNFTDPDFVIEDGVLINYKGHNENVYIPYGVTKIGYQAFYESRFVENVVIPDSVICIENRAFTLCENLISITIPNSVIEIGEEAFCCCTSLNSITLPNAISEIRDSTFLWCINLTSITIPDSVTKIGKNAFEGCSYLYSITIPNNVTEIGDSAFFECINLTSITIPNSVTKIGENAFGGCSDLYSITIPNSVTEIGDFAFVGCINLTSITIPDSVTKIGKNAFYGCSDLYWIEVSDNNKYYASQNGVLFSKDKTEIINYPIGKTDATYTVPDGVVDMGIAFVNCANLISIIIPDTVTVMGNYSFDGCDNLQWIGINSKNATFSSENGVLFNKDKTKIIKYPIGKTDTTYVMPNSVTEIGEHAFDECINLTSITIPNSVTEIGDSAFFECINLTSITIPNSVTYIGSSAFWGCINLTSITIPNGVTYISSCAFWGCINLTSITIPNGVTYISSCAFAYCASLISIAIPDSVITMGVDVFRGHTPSYVFYSGTQSQWLNIDMDDDTINSLNYAVIHHNSTDHLYSIQELIEATCTEDGFVRCVCLICEYTHEEILPASHAWSKEWTVDFSATCTSVGSKSHHCLYCEAKTDVTEIPMISHTWSSEWTVDLSATCTTVGSKSHHCLYCDEKTDITEIPASHTWSAEWTIDVMPTETTDGSKSHHCLYCDEKTDITVIPKLDAESPATDFKYTIKNGEVTINKYIGTSSVMSIPSYIDGYPVTTIDSFAFSNNTIITKVIIPYTVTNLNYYAFYNCKELWEVNFGNGISSVPQNCFSNCSKLQTVYLPETLTTIEDGAFYYCESLTEIVLPDTVEIIESMAFYQCTSLTDINIPDVTYEIGENAFCGTPWLENLTGDCVILGSGILIKIANEFGEDVVIPEGVQTIYSDAFEESYVDVLYIPSTLKNWSRPTIFTVSAYVVNSDNPYLCIYDGVLYNAEKTHLLSAPSKLTGTIILPSTVICIETNAFYSSNLSEVVLNEGLLEIGENAFCFANTKVNIPNTVVTIGDSAFSCCYGITDVVIPQSVTNIGSWAFSGCSNLQSIHFLTANCSIYESSYTIPTNTVLYGCPNSTAQAYAEKYNRNFISMHNMINGVCSVCGFHSEIIFVDEDMHIEGLIYKLNSLYDIENKLGIDNVYVKAYNIDGVELTDNDFVGTGSVICIYDSETNELTDTYTVVLYGDVNGDGLIDDADKQIVTSVAICQATIDNQWFLMAADVNHDGTVDGFDAIETDLQSLDMHNIEQINNSAYISKKENEIEEVLVA